MLGSNGKLKMIMMDRLFNSLLVLESIDWLSVLHVLVSNRTYFVRKDYRMAENYQIRHFLQAR